MNCNRFGGTSPVGYVCVESLSSLELNVIEDSAPLWTNALLTTSLSLPHTPALRYLLVHSANPNIVSNPRPWGSCADCTTPISRAASDHNITALSILLNHGANLDPLAVFYAVHWRNREHETMRSILKLLVSHGADVNYKAAKWKTPPYHAIWRGDEIGVMASLECGGADPQVEVHGKTVTEYARESKMAKKVVEKKRSRRTRGLTPV